MKKIIEDIKHEISIIDKKKLVIRLLPYIMISYVFNKLGQQYRALQGDNLFVTLYEILVQIDKLFKPINPSFYPKDIMVGIVGAGLIYLIVYTKGKNAKKYRKGEEYGSARWGGPKDIKPYIDPIYDENILLTHSERLMMNGRPDNPKYARNKNVLVIGGSGSGKTRFYVKPNLMQMHSSYVVTDPKGTILLECGKLLARGGPDSKPYKIKVFNTINFKKSMHYNPFAYIRSEKDILKLVNTIIANTKGEGEKAGEDFWVSATCS